MIPYYIIWDDPATPTLRSSEALRLRGTQILWILRFSDPLWERKNLIGRDDLLADLAKFPCKVIMTLAYMIWDHVFDAFMHESMLHEMGLCV